MFSRTSLRTFVILISVSVPIFAWGGCTSSPPAKPKPPPVNYTPPPPPPIDDLLSEARDAEKVGLATRSFSAVFGMDEAIRAYQRIVDNYPESDEAKEAKKKVLGLGKKVREIRTWQGRVDKAEKELNNFASSPSGMHPVFARLVELTLEAPEGFIKKTVSGLLERVTSVYQEGALKEVARAAKKAENARKMGDLRGALGALLAVPDAYREDLPRVAEEIAFHREVLEKAVGEKAQSELDRARLALQRRHERSAVLILRQAWEEYRGFEVAGRILTEERRAALKGIKVLTAEAGGRTREIDRDLFRFMEEGFELQPDTPEGRGRMGKRVKGYRKILDKYRAAVEEMTCTYREFEIRRVYLDKVIRWEEKVMEGE